MNKKAQDFDLENFELEDIGLTVKEWRSTLIKINDEAKRLYNKAKLSEEDKKNPEAKEMAAKAQRKAIMLHQRAKELMTQLARAVQKLDIKRNEYSTKKLSPRDIESGAGRRRTRDNVGSGAGYPAGRGGREGRSVHSDTDTLYGNKSPIGMDINLDDPIWSGVQPNPRATINLNDFDRTGGRVLADYYFSGESLSKQQSDQLIFNYLRNRGLYRNAQLRWDSRNDSSVLLVAVMSPQPGRPPTWSTYSFEQAVNASRLGETYDELLNKFSRANSFDLFRKFAISLKREISKVTREMIQDRVNPVLLKDARRFGPKWVSVLNAKIRNLAQ